MKTTLNEIHKYYPSTSDWRNLLRFLGKTEPDDEPLSILTILESNGLDDALWCLRVVKGHDKEIRLFTIFCARQCRQFLTHPDSIEAIEVAERYAHGLATDDELRRAYYKARSAKWISDAKWMNDKTEPIVSAIAASSAAWAAERNEKIATSAYLAAYRAESVHSREHSDAIREAQKVELIRLCKGQSKKITNTALSSGKWL